MSLSRTTLSAAVAVGDYTVVLASLTGVDLGAILQIDTERLRVTSVPANATLPVGVMRGIDGTAAATHPSGAGVVVGAPSDFGPTAVGVQGRRRSLASYSAAGAMALPTPGADAVAILNGTTALAMTLANPSKANDGDQLFVVGNGKAAHTITYTGGLGAGGTGLDVGTFDTNAQCCIAFIAANEVWVPLGSPLSGTLTGADVAIA